MKCDLNPKKRHENDGWKAEINGKETTEEEFRYLVVGNYKTRSPKILEGRALGFRLPYSAIKMGTDLVWSIQDAKPRSIEVERKEIVLVDGKSITKRRQASSEISAITRQWGMWSRRDGDIGVVNRWTFKILLFEFQSTGIAYEYSYVTQKESETGKRVEGGWVQI